MLSIFENLGLAPELVQTVEEMGFEQPTPIQLEAIPALLNGCNVIGQAQTGTGKTAAFALPMIQTIQPGKGPVQALVLTPTRELAMQVADAIKQMAGSSGARVLAVYGGQSYTIQTRALRRGVDIVVGTPGRLLDLMRQKALDLSQVQYLVLDEADEMLEMGFIEDVETILAQAPEKRQTALFSATLPEAVRKLADRYVTDPHQIAINPKHITVADTEQHYVRVREEHKLEALSRLLEVEEVKSALIFARTKARAQDLADELARRGYPAASLHGDLNQARREYVLDHFRHGEVTLLVATDVAARGLDIEDVSHVFNYDVPGDAEDYVHRIGRTGRAGRKGKAITFVLPRERGRLKEIESYTRQAVAEMRVPGREDMQARRDDRFLARLNEELAQSGAGTEYALVTRLQEAGVDLAKVAAAAIRMARAGESSLPAEEIAAPEERKPRRNDTRPGGKRPVRGGEAPRREQEPGMVRLWMSLGNAQGIRPGDVVGAIAGEVGIPGRAIGEIDIHRDFTFLDVAEKHVRQVLLQSSGRYMLRGKMGTVRLAE